ncbi:hypothetical protein ACJZ2D_010361 [Fusarium nematophilum]
MASIHRTTLLRVSPLVSRTAAVWYCFDQWLFFGNFLHRDVRNKTNDFLPAYWNAQMYKGIGAIFSLYTAYRSRRVLPMRSPRLVRLPGPGCTSPVRVSRPRTSSLFLLSQSISAL